jgi:hypothetical protein
MRHTTAQALHCFVRRLLRTVRTTPSENHKARFRETHPAWLPCEVRFRLRGAEKWCGEVLHLNRTLLGCFHVPTNFSDSSRSLLEDFFQCAGAARNQYMALQAKVIYSQGSLSCISIEATSREIRGRPNRCVSSTISLAKIQSNRDKNFLSQHQELQ